ncbi:2,3-diaminopropionate biosynthesis protein SbnB [Agrobacterium salinitolerans]|uniref:2,3-diaminopropionate biosynthesis protein SbnB n=1 Tax=Rhizobium/Agrobacterium group TaxID=227290 RepID=UPI001ADB6F53|nr:MULTISPECIES: 2,3-diaminopropionate biosynthesis protein SbnB [Rhizobium/Agrobacterium group]MBO9112747.1 2,3-diaminopropionate biosynthesis protein SbnB [Agrobacterium sp. S2/73]QXZ76232.1 2,3-diaminopropionate biosynthesis protein SbnB [Agrobacterium sp. S7/73]QYA17220.1 2,3-diaminopropionate biosynthesis protein SbnB [Rhizobium sp. AB2/73]UEQ85206.1 2,3-diaminopropionate biosynthesis protein SbnB [Rhizobium sp. AB2/73]
MNMIETIRSREGVSARLRFLSRRDIAAVGGDRSDLYMEAVEEGFRLHAKGDYAQPLKPYLRNPNSGHIADRIIAMPAWIGGGDPISGLKWIGSKHDNPSRRSIDRASAVIVLNDNETHFPIAVLEAARISALRTAAVTGVAARHLARPNFTDVTVIGCGPIGRTQIQMFCEQFANVRRIHIFDRQPEAMAGLTEWLAEAFPVVQAVPHPDARSAVEAANVVVTATVTDQPYLRFEWLRPGTFLSNISIMDVEKEVFLRADKVVVDDWDQCNREKKIINQLVEEGSFSRKKLHAEIGEIVSGHKPGRENDHEIILLNPMGMAIDDIVCARAILRRAEVADAGILVDLF